MADCDVTFKEVGTSEAALLAQIIQDSFREQAIAQGITREEYPRYVAFTDETLVLSDLKHGNRPVLLLMGDIPIGTIWYKMDSEDSSIGHIRKLAVLPAYRGRDYGKRLFEYAETRARELGATRARLTCNGNFPRLHAYYERLGYVQTRMDRWPTLPFDVLTMEKQLE